MTNDAMCYVCWGKMVWLHSVPEDMRLDSAYIHTFQCVKCNHVMNVKSTDATVPGYEEIAALLNDEATEIEGENWPDENDDLWEEDRFPVDFDDGEYDLEDEMYPDGYADEMSQLDDWDRG